MMQHYKQVRSALGVNDGSVYMKGVLREFEKMDKVSYWAGDMDKVSYWTGDRSGKREKLWRSYWNDFIIRYPRNSVNSIVPNADKVVKVLSHLETFLQSVTDASDEIQNKIRDSLQDIQIILPNAQILANRVLNENSNMSVKRQLDTSLESFVIWRDNAREIWKEARKIYEFVLLKSTTEERVKGLYKGFFELEGERVKMNLGNAFLMNFLMRLFLERVYFDTTLIEVKRTESAEDVKVFAWNRAIMNFETLQSRIKEVLVDNFENEMNAQRKQREELLNDWWVDLDALVENITYQNQKRSGRPKDDDESPPKDASKPVLALQFEEIEKIKSKLVSGDRRREEFGKKVTKYWDEVKIQLRNKRTIAKATEDLAMWKNGSE
eukprot:1717116-Rhodomonas_salina.1